ncbi:MAG: FCSD flavin-binding domain-containing protein [Proteobacteria bacterium]|nr:FCSD flavin-binding domain-containing protein [Pseudomonadota bacterium]
MIISRRRFGHMVGAGSLAVLAGIPAVNIAHGAAAKVVVVGGGFGGATAARYLKRFDNSLDVTLVEPDHKFITCPFSNSVIGGLHDMAYITKGYDGLRAAGVKVIHDRATMVDAGTVTLLSGAQFPYDRAVVSPGVDFKWTAVEGYSEAAAEKIPHAWQAGRQTVLLRKQLQAMPDGGIFLMSAPPNPFRCPPGTGERISLVAHYFKTHKPKSKIIVLDPKDNFSKEDLFRQAWARRYKGMIDYHKVEDDGRVIRVDAEANTFFTDFGAYKGDVANFIPAQKAGAIAVASGLTDETAWCPIDPLTFESPRQKNVHVIGDAAIANPMPKSGFSANTQAKIVAAAVVELLQGRQPGAPKLINTCYSLVAPDYGISIAAVYGYEKGNLVSIHDAGGLTPMDADAKHLEREAAFTESWYRSISADIWG